MNQLLQRKLDELLGQKRRTPRANRVLTLTYYVEPRNLRMVTIPVAKLKAILGVGAVVGVWGVCSILFSVAGIFQGDKAAIGSGLASVERVAAEQSSSAEVVAQPQLSPKSVQSEQNQITGDQKKAAAVQKSAKTASEPSDSEVYDYDKVMAEQIARIKAEDEKNGVSSNIESLLKPRPTTENSAIDSKVLSLKDVNWHETKNKFSVKFAIANSGVDRASGTVYGIAEFVTNDGQIHHIASHNNVNASLLVANKKVGTTFGARKITHKRLSFDLPKGKVGTFRVMRVILNEDSHSQPLVHTQVIR